MDGRKRDNLLLERVIHTAIQGVSGCCCLFQKTTFQPLSSKINKSSIKYSYDMLNLRHYLSESVYNLEKKGLE